MSKSKKKVKQQMSHNDRVGFVKMAIVSAIGVESTKDPNEELSVLSEAYLSILTTIGEKVLGYTPEQNFPKQVLTEIIKQL